MQRYLLVFAAFCAFSVALAAPAAADGLRWPWERCASAPCAPDPCRPPCAVAEAPAPAPCLSQTIPARCELRTRTVDSPPVTCEVRVPRDEDFEVPTSETTCTPEYRDVQTPVYEVRAVPVYAQRCVPQYVGVEVPVYRTRSVPTYTTRKVARYEDVEVPVFACRQVETTREVCDPCTGEIRTEVCGYRTENYQSGTRTQRQLAGSDDEQVQCGTRCERYQDGTETRQRLAGYTTEQYESGTRQESYQSGWRTTKVFVRNRTDVVQSGVRTERRCTGYTTEERVIRPARTDVVTERIMIPARRVTVATGAPVDQVQPLAGTTEVLSQIEYEAALAQAAVRQHLARAKMQDA